MAAMKASPDGKLSYNDVQSLDYIEQMFYEVLRLWPVTCLIRRAATTDYTFESTGVKVKKGTPIFINVVGIHHDPEYYPNPEVYDPERFSKEAKETRHPYAFLGFGHGPRHCVGMRFALLEGKVLFSHLLPKYDILKAPDTPPKLTRNPDSFVGTPVEPLKVIFRKRK